MPKSKRQTQQEIEALFTDGGQYTAVQVMAAIDHGCERYVRTALTRLQDSGKVEARFDDEQGLLVYARASALKPFLLGQCWQRAFEPAVLEAVV